jgi:molybdopterin adenylyltransferase
MSKLNIVILTISDTRTKETDLSGAYLCSAVAKAGHQLIAREIIPNDINTIIGNFHEFATRQDVNVIITTGGTGVTGRDVTPEALESVVEKWIPGFGELFRWLSYQKIGTSTIQSRACAGVFQSTLIFALPGSTGACKDAWNGILLEQLDINYKPCNFAQLIDRLAE